jgi:hypothetical protein
MRVAAAGFNQICLVPMGADCCLFPDLKAYENLRKVAREPGLLGGK